MKKIICGTNLDRMPDYAFRLMSAIFKVTDLFKSPDRRLDHFGIEKGQTVIDWGCGTGRYLPSASQLVGDQGIVYAVDIHELAVESARKIALKYNLKNVIPILTNGKSVDLPSETADLIYALDMFHMVSDHSAFLKMLRRLIKINGCLILEDGHQSRKVSREKVAESGSWEIVAETKAYMKCRPLFQASLRN